MHDLEPFEGPKELIHGAKEYIAEIETACKAFGQSNGYKIVAETDPQTGEKVVYLRLNQKFPPRVMRLASTAIKELRLALDQAFCEAAVALGRQNAKKICFPFGRSIDDLNRVVEISCKNVDRLLIDFCLSFKPHYGEDSDGVLWAMSHLAGTYHRRLISVRFQDQGAFARAVVECQGPLKLIINKWDGPNNQFEVARIEPGSQIKVQDNFAFPLNVIFAQGAHALSGRPVATTLDHLSGVVHSIVAGIEAETARIRRVRLS